MALEVEDGTGKATAESFISVADATNLYHCIAANTIADANWRRVSLGTAY